jgi:acetoin utilization protein AcuB
VSDIMTRDVITIEPDATVGQLVMLMIEHKIGGLPVVQPGASSKQLELLGIVTETDIFQMLADAWRQEEARRAAEA